ncbi:GTPase Der-like isoform X2 [Salvia splendens]|uniref:GTPase Der-like isoform X2 n=1 Tax=Salvia splendens TaxID=180675 RepID=UPI001C2598A1|nr:GTPase Der-like isoform X2 [Salvia splendens]
MRGSWFQTVLGRKSRRALDGLSSRNTTLQYLARNPIPTFLSNGERKFFNATTQVKIKRGVTPCRFVNGLSLSALSSFSTHSVENFCSLPENEVGTEPMGSVVLPCPGDLSSEVKDVRVAADDSDCDKPRSQPKAITRESIDFTKIPIEKLPSVLIIGRPNVGKSALFNRLIRRREALVYNTPNDHVTRDIRDGIAKLGDLRFRVLDSAGLEAEASSGSVLGRTAAMTGYVLAKAHLALFLIDARDGLQPLDLDVGKWLRKHAPGMKTIVVMNKAELLDNVSGSLGAAAGESYTLGFGDPIALSAETGFGLAELSEALRPLLEDFVLQNIDVLDEDTCDDSSYLDENVDSKLPLQLAIVGRPNVGKSTLLNALIQEDRVLVGPEAGLTRDSIRVEFQYEGRDVYLVDTAGWLERTKQDKGPSSLSIVQSRKNLMRAHVVALVLDADEIAKAKRSMKHAEVVIARRAVEEGRSLVIVVNKMDLLSGKQYERVVNIVPEEIQSVIPQVTGLPVVFVSALEGKGRMAVMRQVVDTYEKWCCRLPTSRLNRWLRKVMSRHSWKDQSAQPKIKYFTQVKARPPTFVAFVSGKVQLSDTDLRFLTKSLKEDFDLGGIPLRIMQRTVPRRGEGKPKKNTRAAGKTTQRMASDKRSALVDTEAAAS